jgi:hypothetical protein
MRLYCIGNVLSILHEFPHPSILAFGGSSSCELAVSGRGPKAQLRHLVDLFFPIVWHRGPLKGTLEPLVRG